MKNILLLLLFLGLYTSLFAQPQRKAPTAENGAALWQQSQAAFEENKGQIQGDDAAEVRFHYQQGGLSVFVLSDGLAYQFNKVESPEVADKEGVENENIRPQKIKRETYRMDMRLLNANPQPRISKEQPLTGYNNYYQHDALKVHSYQKITYHEVYPHIDWVIYTQEGGLKYDFVVRPGGNPKDIQIQGHWIEEAELQADGSLRLRNRLGEVTEQAPLSFQGEKEIGTRFSWKNQTLRFELDAYSTSDTLIIDPSLIWATYYGGNSQQYSGYWYHGGHVDCITDGQGSLYLSGSTGNSPHIAAGGHQMTYGGFYGDAFIAKFTAGGTRLWGTFYGGDSSDIATACTVGKFGNVYFCGSTNSKNQIAFMGHKDSLSVGAFSSYLVKLDSGGTRQWATYFGERSHAHDCVVDNFGNVYLVGATDTSANIVLNGHQNSLGGSTDAYVAKFSSGGSLLWSTYYGGSNIDVALGCTVDAFHNLYVTGYTHSPDRIALNGHQDTLARTDSISIPYSYPIAQPFSDAFLVKFNATGQRQWASYYGGQLSDKGFACVTDGSGNVFLAGGTSSSTGIAQNGHRNQKHHPFGSESFLVKFDSTGLRQWATYYGNHTYANNGSWGGWNNNNYGFSGYANAVQYSYAYFSQITVRLHDPEDCALDNQGNIYLSGSAYGYPLGHPLNPASNGYLNGGLSFNSLNTDAYLVKFNSTGQRIWATLYGGDNREWGSSCTIDPFGDAYLAGSTRSITNIGFNGHQDSISSTTLQHSYLIPFVAKFTTDTCAYKLRTINATTCGSYTFKGDSYTASGTYIQAEPNQYGCDSVFTLNLNILPLSYDTLQVNNCISYTLNGQTYTSSGLYDQVFTNAIGCDSIVTLDLTVDTARFDIQTSVCSSYNLNGQSYTSTGIYRQYFTTANGCDSMVVLDLEVKNTNASLGVVSCGSYSFHGQTYTSTGLYTQVIPNAAGCDSTITLYLVLTPAIYTNDQFTTCANSYTWNGQTYNSSGTYTQTLSNISGCDSIVTLDLTLGTVQTSFQASACDSFSWNGQSYNSSGAYTQQFTTVNGCDSIVTLDLNISNSSGDLFVSNCGAYTLNGQSYSSSGTYIQSLTNAAGCDSTLTLHLSVSSTISDTFQVSSCDTITWNGQSYGSPGYYSQLFNLPNGCDSTAVMHLRNINSSASLFVNACNSYTLNGQTYQNSGIYSQTLINYISCDSIITLHLTIDSIPVDTFSVNTCGSYAWNGITYAASGLYSQSLTTAGGCDSTVYLDLNLSPIDTGITMIGDTLVSNTLGATYQWLDCYNGFTPILGATNRKFTTLSTGRYAVEITKGTCVDTSVCQEYIIVGTQDLPEAIDFTLYPNPTSDLVTVEGSSPIQYLQLYDALGRKIRVINNAQFSVAALPAGTYWIEIYSEAGIFRKAFVKR